MTDQELLSKIKMLSPKLCTAFATACASRVLQKYIDWSSSVNWGDKEHMSKALELAWRFVEGEAIPSSILSKEAEIAYSLVPDSEDFASGSSSGALDAGSAVVYALECAATGSPEHAAYAAEAAFVAFDIVRHNDPSSDPELPEKERNTQYRTLEKLLTWGERPISRQELIGT